jgi:iron(III) transport system substrate-binding protein
MSRSKWSSSLRSGRLRSTGVAGVALALGLALAGCGGSPTSASSDKASGDSGSLQKVYDELEGVTDLQERREKLIDLAKDEGGSVTLYSAFNEDDVITLVKDFEKKTGIKVEVYRAGSSDVRQRVDQEAQAGGIRADVVSVTGSDPGILEQEGHYADLDTPITDQLIPEAVFPHWFGDQVYAFAAAWNSDRVKTAPTDFKDLLQNFSGPDMSIEQTDADWMFGSVQYLEQEEGMSEDDALALVTDAISKSTPADGHTTMTELIAAGQFDISPDNYHYRVATTIDDGGHLAWDPTLPILGEFGGTGIALGAPHPAAALLLAEYIMVDNQQVAWVASQRTATLKDSKIGVAAEPDAKLFYIDYSKLIPEIGHYQDLFSKALAATGKDPVS